MTQELGSQNKILITGSEGFIGKYLMKAYPDALGYDLVDGENILDLTYLKGVMHGCDTVVHLAGVAGVTAGANEVIEHNIRGTANVIEACVANKVKKLVFASSAAVYDDVYDSIGRHAKNENSTIRPCSPYGISKAAAEMFLSLGALQIPSVVIMRLFNVYGINGNSVINKFIEAEKKGKTAVIHGDGTQTRDYVYVEDLVAAFQAVVKATLPSTIFNVGTSIPTSVNKLAEMIGGEYIHDEPIVEIETSLSDTTLIEEKLGWKPEVSLEQGIKIIKEAYDR